MLTSYADLLKGGESEEAGVVPNKPEESSLLLQVVAAEGETPAMPKGRPPLSKKEADTIRGWIAAGANDDTPAADRAVVDMEHPPAYLAPPVLTSLDFSPDGKLLAVSGYHETLLHDTSLASSGKAGDTKASDAKSSIVARLVGLAERVESVAFSPDGKRLAVVGGSPGRFGEVQIWDVAKRKLTLSVHVGFDTLYGASWSHDGTKVAFGCPDNRLRAIDAKTGEQVLQQGAHTDWVHDTVFSTDDSHLVSVSRDRSVKLTVVATQRFVDNITSITPGALKGGLLSVDMRPGVKDPKQDQIVVGGADGVPKLYHVYTDKKRVIGSDFNFIRAYEKMPGRVYSVCFSRDGADFAAGSSYIDEKTGEQRGAARVYHVDDGKTVAKFSGRLGPVYAVAFHPNGKQVAAAGFDGMVRLFDAANGKLLVEFPAAPISASVAKQ